MNGTSSIRALAWLFVALSLYLFGHAAYDEQRGVAAPPFSPSGKVNFKPRPVERRDLHPKLFRGLMNYEWTCPFVLLAAGTIILAIVRSADRTDPFSPDFAGNDALDECERSLDGKLENKRSPLP